VDLLRHGVPLPSAELKRLRTWRGSSSTARPCSGSRPERSKSPPSTGSSRRRSSVLRRLSALYGAARRGEITAAEGIERVTRINSLKVRFLGDKVLQRTAWKVADELGWETTYEAEFIALTELQADFFVTSDGRLARAVSGLVETATIDALRSA
jgi:predicted nucleic acid-binding protein